METANTSLSRTERLKRITDDVLKNGAVQVDVLSAGLGVSRMTVHRDLEDLERQGVLRKVRNGATAQPSSLFESNIAFRLGSAVAEKRQIAKAAATLIEPGQSIILDEATTLLPLVDELAAIGGVTVITNFMAIIKRLVEIESVRLIALGGEYLPRFDTFTGLVCETSIRALSTNAYFTSTSAISNGGAYHPDPRIATIKQAMMRAASKRYLLCDHSKFGQTALHKVADLDAFDMIIVDKRIPDAEAKSLIHVRDRIVIASDLTN